MSRSNSAVGAASPLDRLAAHVADLVILMPLMAIAMAPFRREAVAARMSQDAAALDLAVLNAFIAAFMVGVLWDTVLIVWKGTTPGRAIFGLRVVDLWTGNRPRPLNVFLRAFTWWLSVLCMGVPFLAVFSNDKRRPLHDRVADTAVVTRNHRRIAAHPTPSELAFGGVFMTVGLVMLTSLGILFSSRWTNKSAVESAELASEDSPLSCEAVSQVHEEWRPAAGQPQASRLSVALTLFFTSRIDVSCLQKEADQALWSKDESTLGYLALSISRSAIEGSKYRDQVCADDPGSEACFVAKTFHPSSEFELKAGESQEEAWSAIHDFMSESEAPPPLTATSAEWYRAFRLEKWPKSQAREGLAALEGLAPHRDIDATYTIWRAQLMWELGRSKDAHAMLDAKLPLLLPVEKFRAQVAWCGAELALRGCSSTAKKLCGAPLERLEKGLPISQFLTDRQVVDLFGAAECRDQGRPSTSIMARLSREGSREAQRWLAATQYWREGQRQAAKDEFRKLLGVGESDTNDAANDAANDAPQPTRLAAEKLSEESERVSTQSKAKVDSQSVPGEGPEPSKEDSTPAVIAHQAMFTEISPELQVEGLARLSEMLDLNEPKDRELLNTLTDRWLSVGLDANRRDIHVSAAGLRLLQRLVASQQTRSALDLAKVLEESLDRSPNLRARLAILSFRSGQSELAKSLLDTQIRSQRGEFAIREPAQVKASGGEVKRGRYGEVEQLEKEFSTSQPLSAEEKLLLVKIRRGGR